ncbi:MAG: hypothetical protein O3A95_05120 [Planctomycetota bacterium]|nr:hypothetical protein [Planctomycetota bacterium]
MFGFAMQLGEVELPSDVAALPVDYLAWVVLMVGVFVALHIYAKWLLQRKSTPQAPQLEPLPEASSLLEDIQALRNALPNLSQTQLQEALTLSLLMRRACGSSWSSTEQELLREASPDARDGLRDLLHFTTRILFAKCLATKEQWTWVLDHAEIWMKQHAEGEL